MTKINRQSPICTSQPPTKGPTAEATPVRPDHAPIARARSSSRKLACKIARLPGVSMAPPTPCTMRPATNSPSVGANVHSAEARANTATPTMNRRTRPYRSDNEPLSRIKDESVTMYPLTIHCMPDSPVPRSSWMAGSATVTTVESRNAIPDPRTVASSVHRAAGVPQAVRPDTAGVEAELFNTPTPAPRYGGVP